MSNLRYLPATLAEQLTHPYSRYGLAVALRRHTPGESVTEDELRDYLIFALEDGMGHFRMRTADNPQHSTELKYEPVRRTELLANTSLVQSAGLAGKGHYLYPSIITSEKTAQDTFKSVVTLVKMLKELKPLDSKIDLKRSLAPTTAKINNGTASQKPPKGSVLEAACSAIATMTAVKPAALIKKKDPKTKKTSYSNTAVMPDLPFISASKSIGNVTAVSGSEAKRNDYQLQNFISLFDAMANESADLMRAKLPSKAAVLAETPVLKATKSKKASIPKTAPASEYKHPRLHGGNYPDAPYQTDAFGPVGLLAAIGRWARRARQTAWASEVLASLADAPLYVVSYDSIRQVRFGHHVVRLAQENKLADIVTALYRDTVLYRDTEATRRYDNPTYQLFYFKAARFLQLFNRAAFADFLAQRAEYAAPLQPLFNEYFMSNLKIDTEVVQSVKALGRWLNNTAYRVAEEEVDAAAGNRAEAVRRTKAKILVEFESAAMSAKSPTDLLFRISTRAGRLLGSDAPAAADVFMDATALGEENGGISKETATNLLIAYMRLRGKTRKATEENLSDETNPALTGSNPPDDSNTEDLDS